MGSGSVFSVIHCGSFYGKYNKLPMDKDAIRIELEHSCDDHYLCDLDEEFRDLSSEEDNGVSQVSRAEPSCKRARISIRTLSVDSEDSEEEIGVERTEAHVIKSDSETNVAVGGDSVCAGGDDGNGEETESNGADCEHDANLDVSGTAQARNSNKNVTLKDIDPPQAESFTGAKNQWLTSSSTLCDPTSVF